MLVIGINIVPYLAAYAQHRYKCPVPDAVRFPSMSLINQTIINKLTIRPAHINPGNWNLRIVVAEPKYGLKDLSQYDYLPPAGEREVFNVLRMDFDATLHKYMDTERYERGVFYKDSVASFIKKYELAGLISEDALLKKHVRWKRYTSRYRAQTMQLDINFK